MKATTTAARLGVPVRLRAIRYTYRAAGVPVEALRGVDLDIAAGERVAVVGPSGGGKSTLLSIVGGLERPSAGDVEVAGLALKALGERALAGYRLRMVGFVFQSFELIAVLSAAENVALPLELAGQAPAEAHAAAREALSRVGLEAMGDKLPDQLSGGQRQRVAIARVIAHRPPLVLADEPTGNLDTATASEVLDTLFGQVAEAGATLVMVTHDPVAAARADRSVSLADGCVA